MHLRSFSYALAFVALSATAFAQSPAPISGFGGGVTAVGAATLNPGALLDAYQVNYLPAQNTVGGGILGGYIDITNAGELGADPFGPTSGSTGNICVNVFAFTADQELSECCTCLVTPNALVHLTASDLISNAGNGATPLNGIVVKLLATIPGTATAPGTGNAGNGTTAAPTFTGTACSPTLPTNFTTSDPATNFLAPGMRAWATKFHSNPTTSPQSTSLTETSFLPALLSPGEFSKLEFGCRFLRGNQSGAGICKSCTLGGLGASKN